MPNSSLGELLARLVPEPPVTIDASEVLRQARRRERLRGPALLATALVAAAVTVGGLVLLVGAVRDSPAPVSPVATKPAPAATPSSTATPTSGPAPRVVGLTVDAAVTTLMRAQCGSGIRAIVNDATTAVGQVLAQQSSSGDVCEVTLTISAGPSSSASPCTSLLVTADGFGVAAGHAGFHLLFRNSGHHACSLTGYPTVMATDSATGRSIAAQHTPSGYMGGTDLPVPRYVLRPGDQVSAMVEALDVPLGNQRPCSQLIHLRVTVHGNTTPVAPTLSNCAGLQVHPYLPGTTGTAR